MNLPDNLQSLHGAKLIIRKSGQSFECHVSVNNQKEVYLVQNRIGAPIADHPSCTESFGYEKAYLVDSGSKRDLSCHYIEIIEFIFVPQGSRNFYNTIGLTGKDLQDAQGKTKAQEEAVLLIFGKVKKETALGIHRIYVELTKKKTPATSIRRAITDLTEAGKLVKMDEMVEEEFGMPNHLYKLAA